MNTQLLNSEIPINDRKKILLKIRDMVNKNQEVLTNTLYYDLHKPSFESKHMEIIPILNEIDYHLENFESWIVEKKWVNPLRYLTLFLSGMSRCSIERMPYGKVLIIGAWNYPIHLSVLPLIGAISGGNSVHLILPDLNYTHHTSNKLYTLFKAYFPHSNYINVDYGSKDKIQSLLKYKWDFIFFTGSKRIGKIIYKQAAEQLTPVVLELGGKSPCIIDSKINNLLIKRIVWGKFTNCGQTCIAPDYILIQKKYANDILPVIKKTIIDFYGSNQQNSNDLSRIVNKNSFNRLKNILVQDQKYIYYGSEIKEDSLYIQPTILNFENNLPAFLNSASMQEEIFGPIMPIYQYNSINELVSILDKHPTPLTGYLFGNNVKRYSQLIKSGSIVYNDTLMQMNTPLPFGGIGTSGIGNYHGKYSFDTFTYQKSILNRSSFGEISMRFPPYNNKWKLLIMDILSRYIRNSKLIYNSFLILILILVFQSARNHFKI